jgi:hypothetical protein
MLLNELKLIEIFVSIDDFCVLFEQKLMPHLLKDAKRKKSVNAPSICLSEMMCIELMYHLSGHKCFQYYYEMEVLNGSLKSYFPKAPSYNRFVELKPRMLIALIAYLHLCCIGRMVEIFYADSTVLTVCHNRRIHSHRVFAHSARRGKTSTGLFFGFKLFIVINAFGELIRAFVTPANQADNSEKILRRLFTSLKGYVYADKGFIHQKIVEEFYQKGLRIITGIRSNMKNKLIEMKHKLLLRKRGVIEAVNDILKTVCDIEHTRHRSPGNMLVNTYGALIAYSWLERKPNIFTSR